MDAALLAGSRNAKGLGRVVADIALVDIGPLDLGARQRLGLGDDACQDAIENGHVGECVTIADMLDTHKNSPFRKCGSSNVSNAESY